MHTNVHTRNTPTRTHAHNIENRVIRSLTKPLLESWYARSCTLGGNPATMHDTVNALGQSVHANTLHVALP